MSERRPLSSSFKAPRPYDEPVSCFDLLGVNEIPGDAKGDAVCAENSRRMDGRHKTIQTLIMF